MELIEALDRRRRRTSGRLLLRQVTVNSVQSGTSTITIDYNGTIEGVHYLDSYSPTQGDTVWALFDEPDILVLGKLA